MNEEEKAVFDCLEDDVNVFAGAYDDLEEDFMLTLNGGQPALELITEMPKERHENEGIIVVEEVEHPMMIENYKERMADVIAMLAKQEEIRKEAVYYGKKVNESEVKKAVNQKQLDDVFLAYMDKEYKDEQIGDLDGDEGVDPLGLIEGDEEEGEAE